jgi:hypothetical protein
MGSKSNFKFLFLSSMALASISCSQNSNVEMGQDSQLQTGLQGVGVPSNGGEDSIGSASSSGAQSDNRGLQESGTGGSPRPDSGGVNPSLGALSSGDGSNSAYAQMSFYAGPPSPVCKLVGNRKTGLVDPKSVTLQFSKECDGGLQVLGLNQEVVQIQENTLK